MFVVQLLLAATVCLVSSNLAFAEEKFFPAGTFGSKQLDDFRNNWYSKQLRVLQETSLYGSPPAHETYRFTWLRSFHHPMTFRLEIAEQCAATLTIKETDGALGYGPGKIILNKTMDVGKADCEKLVASLEDMKFWSLATSSSELGMDGAQWILEGSKNGRYHIVDRWTPLSGAFYEWALSLMKLADVPLGEIY